MAGKHIVEHRGQTDDLISSIGHLEPADPLESALRDPDQKSSLRSAMSALLPKTDIRGHERHASKGPVSDSRTATKIERLGLNL